MLKKIWFYDLGVRGYTLILGIIMMGFLTIIEAKEVGVKGGSENHYNDIFCSQVEGQREKRHYYFYGKGEDKERSYISVDCETDTKVYEGGRDTSSSKDSIQQALFFRSLTGKKAVVVIYDTDGKWGRWEHRIKNACELICEVDCIFTFEEK